MAIHRIIDPRSGGSPVVSDRELYTDASRTKLLEAGDDAAAFLVASGPGKVIPAEFVTELGLETDEEGRVKQRKRGEDKELAAVAQDKDATPPVEDGEHGWDIMAIGASDVQAMSTGALKAVAKARHVPGYGKMNREELIAAIVEGGAMQAGGANPDQSPDAGKPEDPGPRGKGK